jgi:hypothetical protein
VEFQIHGADAATGAERDVILDASSREEALRMANERGIFVSSVSVLNDRSPVPVPPLYRRRVISSHTEGTIFGVVVLGGGLLLIILICAGIFHSSPAEKQRTKAEDDRIMALTMAQGFVKDSLKSPSSASFPWDVNEYRVSSSDGIEWTVSGYVDAQNSFGAQIRNKWTVDMKHGPNGGWQLTNIDIHE